MHSRPERLSVLRLENLSQRNSVKTRNGMLPKSLLEF